MSRRWLPLLLPEGNESDGSAEGDGSVNPLEDRVAAAEAAAASAIAKYRELVSAGPGLVPAMVQGSTVEEIDASVEIARQAYSEISRRITEAREQQVPTGNPTRSASLAGAEALTPEAKIALGLRGSR